MHVVLVGNVSLWVSTGQGCLVVPHDFGDHKVQELFGELRVELCVLGERPQRERSAEPRVPDRQAASHERP